MLILLIAGLLAGCGGDQPEPVAVAESSSFGEPIEYSAIVLRTVDDGHSIRTFEMRTVRSGELTREEWVEDGGRFALVLRPDLGMAYLLRLDRKVYDELSLDTAEEPFEPPAYGPAGASWDGAIAGLVTSPVESELPPRQIGDYHCRVFERKVTFPDGGEQTRLSFIAVELNGLPVRVESRTSSPEGTVIVVTERKDVRLSASAEEFTIPPGFTKR